MSTNIDTMTDDEFEDYMRKMQDDVVEPTAEEEDNTNEGNDDLEQPVEDSIDEQSEPDSNEQDDNTDGEEDTDNTNKDSNEGESNDEPDDKQPKEDNTEQNEPEVKTELYKLRADGQDLELTVDELKILASKGINYGRKTRELAPWRKQISAIQEANLSQEDLSMMIDAFKGDKGAIGKLFEKNGIDPLEYEKPEQTYVPRKYGKNDTELQIQDVVDSISKDAEYERTQKVLTSEWDERSWTQLVDSLNDPSMRLRNGATLIEGLHIDIKNGMYDKIMPIAKKMKLFGGNNKSDFEYYMDAVDVYNKNQSTQQYQQKVNASIAKSQKDEADVKLAKAKEETAKREATKADSEKRKAAAVTKSTAGKRTVIDYLDDMNDSDFEKEMDKLLKGK